MTFTRSQKVCFGLLGVGLVALAADRSFGGGGDKPDVATPAAATAGLAVRPTNVGTSGEPPTPGVTSLATKLRALVPDAAMAAGVPDAFELPAAWSAAPSQSSGSTLTAFRSAHALKAVLGSGRGGRVLLGDRLVAVGDAVDGLELVEVRERHAVFAGTAGRVVLELPGPFAGR